MKNIGIVKQVFESLIIATIPVIVLKIGEHILGKDIAERYNVAIYVASCILSALIIFLFNKYIFNLKCFRKYKKYEGKWIEIIPGFTRKISVCNLSFKYGEYHFNGVNYSEDKDAPIEFYSKKFIENGTNSFFYITKCNLMERTEGFGKIMSFSSEDKNCIKANGYFFDVASEKEQKVHKTIMIKFDENFYDNNLSLQRGEDPAKFSDREIYEHVKEYVEKNYNLEDLV